MSASITATFYSRKGDNLANYSPANVVPSVGHKVTFNVAGRYISGTVYEVRWTLSDKGRMDVSIYLDLV